MTFTSPRAFSFVNQSGLLRNVRPSRAALPLLICLSQGFLYAQTIASAPRQQDFGQVQVNGPAKTIVLSYTATGNAPTFATKYAVDFRILSAGCSGLTSFSCQLSVSFAPRTAGARQDAILVNDASGNLIATTLLSGVGLGSQISVYPGVISTLIGRNSGSVLGNFGQLSNPQGLVVDCAGNLYVSDSINQVIVMLNAQSGLLTTIAGNGRGGYSGDGGPAAAASLNSPAGLAIDGAGNLYVADQGNNVIRRIDGKTRQISTVAGGGNLLQSSNRGDGGLATNALLNGPNDVAVDRSGDLFIADSFQGLVRRVDASTGIISTIAGGGTNPGTDGLGNNGPAVKASLDLPMGVALDANGAVFIADTGHSQVRRIDPSSGNITVVAGNGLHGFSGDSGPATSASLGNPYEVRIDAAGSLYILDQVENLIRQVSATTGVIRTLAGNGASRYAGDGGPATNASFYNPSSLALDSAGTLYIADTGNGVVRKIVRNNAPLNFPASQVGLVGGQGSITIANIGNEPVSITSLKLSANFQQWMSGATDCSAASVLQPSGQCGFTVQFVPAAGGSIYGTLTVSQASLSGQSSFQAASLSGLATSSANLPQLTVSPNTFNFGTQAIGVSSAPQNITLSNTGTAPLYISSLTLGGNNALDFTLTTGCPFSLAAGAKCSATVTFSPSAVGTRTASLAVLSNLASSQIQVSLSGTGGQPQIAFDKAKLAFANQPAWTSSSPLKIVISNNGSAPLLLSGVALGGPNAADFVITNTCGASVAASASCSLNIVFTPRGLGLRTASIVLSDNAAGTTQTLALTGTGSTQSSPTVLRPSNCNWYYSIASTGKIGSTLWAAQGDIAVPADYDGDGVVDFAVYRPSTGVWWIIGSRASAAYTVGWGLPGDIPVPGDYDGDGKTDISVYRPANGTWWIIGSRTSTAYSVGWGLPGDIPVPGDYDGDGKTDVSVYRPADGTWWIIGSRTSAAYSVGWGLPGDIPVPGDYDGDGKTDVSVYRPADGTWWIIHSSNSLATAQYWGTPGDIPVPGDYDGDGKTDTAIYRPSNGTWWVINSKNGSGSVTQLGASGDIPVRGFYRP